MTKQSEIISKIPIEELKERVWNPQRCEADVGLATQRWRHHAGQDIKCQRTALYIINGVPMCAFHAGRALIRIALGEKDKG